jgi:hypothetical protein
MSAKGGQLRYSSPCYNLVRTARQTPAKRPAALRHVPRGPRG